MAGPPPEEQPMRRLSVVLTAVVLVAALAACSSSKADNKSKPNDSAAQTLGTQLTQREKDERDIKAVIKGWYHDFSAAKGTPKAPHPELSKWASHHVLEGATKRLSGFAQRNQRAVPAPHSRADVVVLGLKGEPGASYAATVCELDDSRLVDASTGKVLNADATAYRTTWQIVHQSGRWLLADSDGAQEVGPGSGAEWASQCRD